MLDMKTRKVLQSVMMAISGLIGLVLFRWTPATLTGLAIFGALAVLLVVFLLTLGHFLDPNQDAGYWPKRPEKY